MYLIRGIVHNCLVASWKRWITYFQGRNIGIVVQSDFNIFAVASAIRKPYIISLTLLCIVQTHTKWFPLAPAYTNSFGLNISNFEHPIVISGQSPLKLWQISLRLPKTNLFCSFILLPPTLRLMQSSFQELFNLPHHACKSFEQAPPLFRGQHFQFLGLVLRTFLFQNYVAQLSMPFFGNI